MLKLTYPGSEILSHVLGCFVNVLFASITNSDARLVMYFFLFWNKKGKILWPLVRGSVLCDNVRQILKRKTHGI